MANPELTRRPSSLDTKAKAVARALTPASAQRSTATRKLATGLGWFSIGLGLVELLATRRLARLTGLHGHEMLLRAYGVREIASGVGLLTSTDPATTTGWVRARLAGDGLDMTTLAMAAVQPDPRGGHPLVALAAVAGVTAMDVACARTLDAEADARRQDTDYSGRSGIPSSPDLMRGAALDTFDQPADMRSSPEREQREQKEKPQKHEPVH